MNEKTKSTRSNDIINYGNSSPSILLPVEPAERGYNLQLLSDFFFIIQNNILQKKKNILQNL